MSNQKFKNLVKQYYDFMHRTYPVMATYLGIHQYDNLVGDFSAPSLRRDIKSFKDFQQKIKIQKSNIKNLNLETQTDLRLLESEIEMNIFSLEKTKDWQNNPNLYVETLLMSVFLLTSRNSVAASKKVKAVVSRLNQFGRILKQAQQNLKNPPRIYTEIALEALPGALFFVDQIGKKLSMKSDRHTREKLKRATAAAKTELEGFQQYLNEDLLPKSKGKFALGQKLFEKRLKTEHFLNLSAPRLYNLGWQEFDRIAKQLKILARRMDSQQSWQQLVEKIKDQTPPAKDLLVAYRREVKKLVHFIKQKKLLTFAKSERCQVLETPDFERPTVPYAAYMPAAPFEKDQTGHFWVTPVTQNSKFKIQNSKLSRGEHETLREHCKAALVLTTLHESYPGHHLQFSRANQVRSLVRKHGGSSLLCEGWALYCEQLMGEVGYYRSRAIKLFALKDQLWRAARIIIDVGLHCRRWSIKKAIDLLVKEVKLAPAQAEAEVKRYTMSPTQPMSYLVGKLLILELRKQAQQRWGPEFSLKRFHDDFLSAGTIPPPLIEAEMFGSPVVLTRTVLV